MEELQYRHGDILLQEVGSLPVGAVFDGRLPEELVLAYGEVTGHAHKLRSKSILRWHEGSQTFITLEEPGQLDHLDGSNTLTGEHQSLVIAPGTYKVIPQQQWDLYGEMRRVTD